MERVWRALTKSVDSLKNTYKKCRQFEEHLQKVQTGWRALEHLQKVQTVWRALTKSADSQHLSLPACKRLDDDDLARADHIIELELIYLKSESLLRIIT